MARDRNYYVVEFKSLGEWIPAYGEAYRIESVARERCDDLRSNTRYEYRVVRYVPADEKGSL